VSAVTTNGLCRFSFHLLLLGSTIERKDVASHPCTSEILMAGGDNETAVVMVIDSYVT
jgi:hypothetical protein